MPTPPKTSRLQAAVSAAASTSGRADKSPSRGVDKSTARKPTRGKAPQAAEVEDLDEAGDDEAIVLDRPSRQVKLGEKAGRKPAQVSEIVPLPLQPVYGATELAKMLGYTRDNIYKWASAGMPKADPALGNGWQLPTVLQWNLKRVEANARPIGTTDDDLDYEDIRLKRAKADMAEDARDKSRKELIEVDVARAVYEDDLNYVARHLRSVGVKVMNRLAVEGADSPETCLQLVNAAVEGALNHINADHVDPNCPDCHPYLGGVDMAGRG